MAAPSPLAWYTVQPAQRIMPEDMDKLAALNLKVDYDLRTAEERDKRPDELPPVLSTSG
jgi:hypothetical protein